jgi:hypothetical protein
MSALHASLQATHTEVVLHIQSLSQSQLTRMNEWTDNNAM